MSLWYVAKLPGIKNAILDSESGKPVVGSLAAAMSFADARNEEEGLETYAPWLLTASDLEQAKIVFGRMM